MFRCHLSKFDAFHHYLRWTQLLSFIISHLSISHIANDTCFPTSQPQYLTNFRHILLPDEHFDPHSCILFGGNEFWGTNNYLYRTRRLGSRSEAYFYSIIFRETNILEEWGWTELVNNFRSYSSCCLDSWDFRWCVILHHSWWQNYRILFKELFILCIDIFNERAGDSSKRAAWVHV